MRSKMFLITRIMVCVLRCNGSLENRRVFLWKIGGYRYPPIRNRELPTE